MNSHGQNNMAASGRRVWLHGETKSKNVRKGSERLEPTLVRTHRHLAQHYTIRTIAAGTSDSGPSRRQGAHKTAARCGAMRRFVRQRHALHTKSNSSEAGFGAASTRSAQDGRCGPNRKLTAAPREGCFLGNDPLGRPALPSGVLPDRLPLPHGLFREFGRDARRRHHG